MFKGLKSFVSRAKSKVTSFFGRKEKSLSSRIIKMKKKKYTEADYKKLNTRKNQIMDALQESDDKARQFYINMLTSNIEGVPPELVREARELIYNASDDELDNLQDALGDNGDEDWKDYYISTLQGVSNERSAANKEAKLEQIIQLLSS